MRANDLLTPIGRTELDDTVARNVFVAEIDRPYDDPSLDDAPTVAETLAPLIVAFDACPVAAHLDWN